MRPPIWPTANSLVLCAEGKSPADAFPYRPYHPWNYETWARQHPTPPPPPPGGAKPAAIKRRVEWLLGEGPDYAPVKTKWGEGESDEMAKLLNRGEPAHLKCRFGDLNGNFYYPPGTSWTGDRPSGALAKQRPAIIWLSPLHCPTGYTPGYRTGDIPYIRLAKAGYIVFAFDPVGTGSRQEERRNFYERHPAWSLMGQMVLDARHAIDAVLANPDVDRSRISLVGFGMGGMVAVLGAALDERVHAVVSAAGFTAFRRDTDAAGTGGIRRWSHLTGWLPRLGTYVGQEANVPVDFPEILSTIAPRPVLVVAPTLDWHFPQPSVAWTVEAARESAPSGRDTLTLYSPPALAEFNNPIQDQVAQFLASH
ncbi:MAG: dienelactone hydrolase family protein [Verrucomicrobiota bacterium]